MVSFGVVMLTKEKAELAYCNGITTPNFVAIN